MVLRTCTILFLQKPVSKLPSFSKHSGAAMPLFHRKNQEKSLPFTVYVSKLPKATPRLYATAPKGGSKQNSKIKKKE
ncbi:MAG: hypothetical protein J6X27_02620 [Bacteroidaceae bacterium]|nr:hypothetical protein [Bacteroidaceae bacterium]